MTTLRISAVQDAIAESRTFCFRACPWGTVVEFGHLERACPSTNEPACLPFLYPYHLEVSMMRIYRDARLTSVGVVSSVLGDTTDCRSSTEISRSTSFTQVDVLPFFAARGKLVVLLFKGS